MSLNPRVCKKSYKVHIPMMGEACEFWLITVTDEQSITNPDKDHAYLTDDGKLFVFDGDSLVRVNCDICFTQEEREKLEGIEEGANKYVLPVASSTELGGVLLGYTQNGRNYPITKDTKGNIYVNVPWEEYQLPKATDNALGGIKTGYKQNGKFYPIKTDTDGNAYVQVPWEDTNTVYEVVSKTSNGLMPMLPSDENASKRFLNGDGEWVVGTDNSINGVTQTGSIFSGETSDCGVQILEIQGKTTQQTTNGYQLFDASKLPTKSQGGATVTNNGDGSFTVSGSGNLTENFLQRYDYSKEETLNLLKQGTLKVNGLGNVSPNIVFGLRNKNTGTFVTGKSVNKNTSSCQIKQSDLDSLGDEIFLSISMFASKGTQIVSGTIKPMIYIDGTGEFEPFTGGKPAPNPDYAMPIENVEISEITSHGRNLLEIIKLTEQTLSGVTFTPVYVGESLKYVVVNGTATSQANYVLSNRLNFDKKLVMQGCPVGGSSASYSLLCSYYDRQSKAYKNEVYDIGDGKIVDTDIYETQFIILIRQGTICNNLIFYPMLIRTDDTDTSYTPYQSNTTSTNLTLAQDDIYQQGTITRDRKQAVFDGSSDEAWSLQSINDYGLANFQISLSPISNGNIRIVLSNRFKRQTSLIANTTEEGIYLNDINQLFIRIDKNRLPTQDTSGFKTWLSTHNLVVEYKLATPTTEEYQVPTIPNYEPYTEISTNSVVDPTITFRPLPFTTCLVGEATEEESGYMPPLSGNLNEFLNGNGEWSVPSGYTLPTASSTVLGGVKIGSNISISSGAISIDKDDVTKALGYTPPTANTTYEKVDKSSDGLCPKLPNETTTTKYLRQDGAWATPPNTTYGVASTSANGLMSSTDKTKLNNLRRIWKGTSSSPPSGWVDGDIYVQYEE